MLRRVSLARNYAERKTVFLRIHLNTTFDCFSVCPDSGNIKRNAPPAISPSSMQAASVAVQSKGL